MKKIMLIALTLLLVLVGTQGYTQRPLRRNPQIRGGMMERIREAKWAFIVYKLNLDEQRANRLLPVYRAYEDEKRDIFKGAARQLLQEDSELTDEQAEQLMNAKLEHAQKLLDLKEKYKTEFLKVLTASEVLALQRAELEFASKIQMERQKRRGNR